METKVAPATAVMRRMVLSAITKNSRDTGPCFDVLYGVEGVGKSTFANDCEEPVFIASERGLKSIKCKAKFPEPKCWQDVLDALESLRVDPHGYKTVVIDTIDMVAQLLMAHVCSREGWTSEGFEKYGRGCKVWLQDWLALIRALDALQDERGMSVLLIAHAVTKRFPNPSGNDYDRFGMNVVGKDAPDLFLRRADSVMFAAFEELTTDPEKGRVKGISTGIRWLHTVRTAAWDAKNRYGLPARIAFDWETFSAARTAGLAESLESMVAEVKSYQPKLAKDRQEKLDVYLTKNAADPVAIAKAVNRLRAEFGEAA